MSEVKVSAMEFPAKAAEGLGWPVPPTADCPDCGREMLPLATPDGPVEIKMWEPPGRSVRAQACLCRECRLIAAVGGG